MAKAKAVERPYETVLILPAETPQKTIDTFVEKIKTTLAQAQGTLRGVQFWGRRRLTYPIRHHKDGQFIYLDFNGNGQAPLGLQNLFRVTDFILRHVTVDRREFKEPPLRRPPTEGGVAAPAGAVPTTASATPATPATTSAPAAPAAEATKKEEAPSSAPKEA